MAGPSARPADPRAGTVLSLSFVDAEFINSVDDTRMVASIEETLKPFAITDKMPEEKVFTKAFLPAQSGRLLLNTPLV
ncbi:MAG: hypothetical protein JWL62_3350 [Hyphomicrobiales bacterium]|nr:hypothetical protein [Hyphomicrobiales bacterium]